LEVNLRSEYTQSNRCSYKIEASSGLTLRSSSLHMFLHGEFSADDCARELFKPSKDSPSLRVCSVKKILGFGFFVSDVISGVVLGQWH